MILWFSFHVSNPSGMKGNAVFKKGSCEPNREYEMLTVTQYCTFFFLEIN